VTRTCDTSAEPDCRAGAEHPKPDAGAQMLSDHDVLCALVTSLVQTNRRWQMMAFPAVLAFGLLAAYGFYLVYNLVEDVDKMATAVDINMGFMSGHMSQISHNLDALTGTVRDIAVNLDDLTGTVTGMNVKLDTLPPMLEAMRDMDVRIASMDDSMRSMDARAGAMTTSMQTLNNQMAAITAATQHISGNVSGLNQNIGRPMNFMNNIMPW
jgi:methyl-accepting chemotaxis protein